MINNLILQFETTFEKIFNNEIFTARVKKILIISTVAIATSFLLSIYTILGLILMFLGIGLLMLLAEFLYILPFTIILIVRLFGKGKNKHIEIGLLIGILITILAVIKFLNPTAE